MCKKLTVAYGDFIGQRMVGWCVFNGKDYNFLSDKQIKARLKQGDLVNGLKLDGDNLDNVVRDSEFTGLLMGKSGLAFEPIMTDEGADEDSVMNKYYALVKVVKGKTGMEYHFITNRCGYEIFSEQQLKAMLEVLGMGGIQMDIKGKLVIHKGIEVEQATESQSKAKEDTKGIEVVSV